MEMSGVESVSRARILLSILPLDELVNEVLRRADHGAVVLMQVGVPQPGRIFVGRKLKGNAHTVCGLCFDAAHEALNKADHDGIIRQTEEAPGSG